ncbi:MAG: phosphoribosylformylglycinamidine synthase I [Parcubacteria group bacterium]|jgi:phosphoribosylformylglycinamidine synthase
MRKPKVLILSGYGLNCEEETKFAFELAGAEGRIVHINDLIDGSVKLKNFQILAIPGGFSYGDDTGSGKAYANKIKNHLQKEINDFVKEDKLVIGICNGFQILTNLGLLPGALNFNDSARYTDRWVDIKIEGESPWLVGIKTLSVPIAHGEGKYFTDKKTLAKLKKEKRITAKYFKGEICRYQDYPANPNGALEDIAGVLGAGGKILGMMPHPERAMFFTQLPNWPYLKEKYKREGKKIPIYGPGLKIFQNAVKYFQ